MKKTLLILSLAAGLVSTNAIAQQDQHGAYKDAAKVAVPAPVAQWIGSNNVHVNFFTIKKAEAFADKFGIPHSRITTYVLSSKVSTKEPQKIFAINYILPSKKDIATR